MANSRAARAARCRDSDVPGGRRGGRGGEEGRKEAAGDGGHELALGFEGGKAKEVLLLPILLPVLLLVLLPVLQSVLLPVLQSVPLLLVSGLVMGSRSQVGVKAATPLDLFLPQ